MEEKDFKNGVVIKTEGCFFKVVDDKLVYCSADNFKIKDEHPLRFSVMSLGLYITALHGMIMFNKTIPFSEIEIIKINRNN
jgi:hypothetical protein